jgi:ABC-type transport system substrate-binding protein
LKGLGSARERKGFYNFPGKKKTENRREGKMKNFGKWAIWAVFILWGITILFPGPILAAPKGQIVCALSSDISTLDPQNHNIRVNYIVGWHLYDNLVYRDQKTLKIGPCLAESWKIVDDTPGNSSCAKESSSITASPSPPRV